MSWATTGKMVWSLVHNKYNKTIKHVLHKQNHTWNQTNMSYKQTGRCRNHHWRILAIKFLAQTIWIDTRRFHTSPTHTMIPWRNLSGLSAQVVPFGLWALADKQEMFAKHSCSVRKEGIMTWAVNRKSRWRNHHGWTKSVCTKNMGMYGHTKFAHITIRHAQTTPLDIFGRIHSLWVVGSSNKPERLAKHSLDHGKIQLSKQTNTKMYN